MSDYYDVPDQRDEPRQEPRTIDEDYAYERVKQKKLDQENRHDHQ